MCKSVNPKLRRSFADIVRETVSGPVHSPAVLRAFRVLLVDIGIEAEDASCRIFISGIPLRHLTFTAGSAAVGGAITATAALKGLACAVGWLRSFGGVLRSLIVGRDDEMDSEQICVSVSTVMQGRMAALRVAPLLCALCSCLRPAQRVASSQEQ